MSVITQNDYIGLVSLAMYRAAAEVAGIEIIEEKLFGFETIDFAPVVSGVIAKNPDILCWDTAYPDYVNLLTEQAFQQNYQGQIVTCTLDGYTQMLEKSSVAFMEGSIWQFPDFDDEAVQAEGINFAKPREFFNKYEERHQIRGTSPECVERGVLGIRRHPRDVERRHRSRRRIPPHGGVQGAQGDEPRAARLW